MRTREAYPEQWAGTQTNLANAYMDRMRGSKAENFDAAIDALQAVFTVFTRRAFPQDWARAQNNLANAYLGRIRGSKADNVELAIKAYDEALKVRTREAFPVDWAETQNNLANAFTIRVHGAKADNQEAAIAAYKAALAVRTRGAFPRDWASTLKNLGGAYHSRISGSKADNLEEAIKAYEQALTVSTQKAFPHEWALTQNNLGNSYRSRIQGNKAENLEMALNAYVAALTVTTREASPEDWARTQFNLANLYFVRSRGSKADNLEPAIKAFEEALTVHTQLALPRDHLRTGRLLGKVMLEKHAWKGASRVYTSARVAFQLLFGQGLEDAEAQDLIGEAGLLFVEAALASAELGDLSGSFKLLTEGKARLMAVALRQQSLTLSADKRDRFAALKTEIRALEPVAERGKGEEGAKALTRLIELRRELGEMIERATAKDTTDAALSTARALVPQGGVLLAPIVTPAGSKILLLRSGKDGGTLNVFNLPELTTTVLAELMRGPADETEAAGWLGAFDSQFKVVQLKGELDALTKEAGDPAKIVALQKQQAQLSAQWHGAIGGVGGELWRLFGGAVQTALNDASVKPGARIIWMPAGALGLLPIGLAQDSPDKPRLSDLYEIVHAPSLEAMSAAQRQTAMTPPAVPTLAAIVNPTGDLPFTETEGALVSAYFPKQSQLKLDQTNAEPSQVLAALKGKSYWHFASHGTFDWADARRSGLLMKGKQALTVQSLLDNQSQLGKPRLVVLSACETGLYDIDRNPDEFVGLPATFMQLGASGVIGTLWQVDDLATSLLIARFYELHLDKGLAPPTALKQAQAWLRTSTKAELIAYATTASAIAKLDPVQSSAITAMLSSRNRGGDVRAALIWSQSYDTVVATVIALGKAWTEDESLKSRPFAHPYYWGGFVYTGL